MKKFICIVLTLISFVNKNVMAQSIGCQHTKQAAFQNQPPLYNAPENLKSDTFNILKYTINLEIGSASNKFIKGNTIVKFNPKINNRNFIRLDLLKLIVDSVKEGASLLSYSYNDTVLKINFASQKNTIDTPQVIVYYHGLPQGDASGWGGFYFDNQGGGDYAYNLGVGFAAKPHNYGRVWFPCFDNFVERSRYEFNITNDSARRAYCNGQLISDIVTGNKRTRKWVMNTEIPTYLASIAVAKYRQVNWQANTLNGPKPITLAAVANDTTPLKTSFVNLNNCIAGFENYFGPYMWNRFGYCLVPFNSGAMEHATNIAYPRAVIGNLTYEAELMAHELAHHWWGDLITCETAEDMWINEGMASYSAFLFTEWQYGKNSYNNKYKSEHDKLVQFLHKKEGGFRAVSGVPHNLTYGDHVYKKGADIAHTLRGYLGDTLFFNACKYAMQQSAHKHLNSLDLRDLFQTSSGKNLTDFFNNWVLSPGWSHFSVDSIKYSSTSSFPITATVFIKQKLHGAINLHSNVPLELSFFDNNWQRTIKKFNVSGATSSFTTSLNFVPIFTCLNLDNKIGDATSSETRINKTNGQFILWNLGKIQTNIINKGADSSYIRVIHNFVKPDNFKNNTLNARLSNQHYWKLEGKLSPGFYARGIFFYNGIKTNSPPYGYMDTLLAGVNADSLALFYRKDAKDDWTLVTASQQFSNTTQDGNIRCDTLKLGEYTFGNIDKTTLNLKEIKKDLEFKIFPNPAKEYIELSSEKEFNKASKLKILNVEGKLIYLNTWNGKTIKVKTDTWSNGTYFVEVNSATGETKTKTFVLNN